MTIRTDSPKPAAAAAQGATPLTPEQIIEHLRIVRDHVPDFGPLPPPESVAMRNVARVHPEMIHAAIHTVGAAAGVMATIGRGVEELRQEEADVGRWRAVEAELEALLSGVKASNLARRHRLGLTTLQTYHITRQLVRQKEHADLLPHVQAMRRANRFGRRRREADVPPPFPAPVTQSA